MSEIIKNRSEIVFLYDVKDANPNGDPLDGNKPRIVVNAVIKIGRKRERPPSTMASSFAMPLARNWLIKSMSTMALFTTIPASKIKPMKTTTLMVEPVIQRANTAPINANGIVNKITNGCRNDSNWDAMTR